MVKRRNAKCLHDANGFFDWSFIKFQDLNNSTDVLSKETIAMWSNLNVDDTKSIDIIVDNLNKMCIDSYDLIDLFDDESSVKNKENLFNLILTQLGNKGCNLCDLEPEVIVPITRAETWGYGILFVTLISTSSLCGAFVIPLSNRKIYKKMLMFLIAIAVGSLAGSGFLHLIPQAYGITEDPKYNSHHAYVWKGLAMMGGVYLFYLVEKIMKIMILRKKALKRNSSLKMLKAENPKILESIGYLKTHEQSVEPSVEMRVHISTEVINNSFAEKRHGHSHDIENLNSVAPVAWMIIFGDGLHNFIDGLSIGAAFTESLLKGISICLAVICEEFPHELGDFAILINAGMSYRVALFFNFLSACCCFLGLAVGITLGENFGANEWIYAVAGGMFLYIALCDMIPELNEMGDEIEKDCLAEMKERFINDISNMSEEEQALAKSTLRLYEPFDLLLKIKILIIQNIGIIFGFSFMLLMAIYSERIQL